MNNITNQALALWAARGRLLAVDAVHTAASGHPGGSLSCMDALTTLYFAQMNVDPADPKDPDRDRFVMSKGHCAPALYSVLALRGFFPTEDMKLLRSIKAHYSGHPDMAHVRGVDMSTGSLAQGLSAAVGMALAAKVQGKAYRTYAICGDGELAARARARKGSGLHDEGRRKSGWLLPSRLHVVGRMVRWQGVP